MNQNKILNWQDLKSFIYYDKICQGGGAFFRKFFLSPVFRFTVLLMVNEFLVNKNYGIFIRFLPYLWYRRLGVRLGFSIPLNVFDYGLGIVHYGLLIVNDDAIIGKNCRIHAGVNIGGAGGFKNTGDTKWYALTLGDNCYIGPGAKLFGPIVIGSNVAIGANAVVNKSFAEGNYTIGGIPAKIISSKSSEGLVYKL